MELGHAPLVDVLDELRVVVLIHQRPPLDVEYLGIERLTIEIS
jgi:hypothetical protein